MRLQSFCQQGGFVQTAQPGNPADCYHQIHFRFIWEMSVNMSSWRVVVMGVALIACACFAWPDHSYGRSRAHVGSKPRAAAHLYVLLGLGNNSPGLSEFGSRTARHSDDGRKLRRLAGARARRDPAIQERAAAFDHDRWSLTRRRRRCGHGSGTWPSGRPGPTGGDARSGGRVGGFLQCSPVG